mgnify:CR=1 FL=1
MIESKTVYAFDLLSTDSRGHIAITSRQWPWCVLQVVTTTLKTFDAITANLLARGEMVAHHDTDRTFCIIHLCSGDQGGKYPEKHVDISDGPTARKFISALKDCMAQAAVWYYTNIIEPRKY